MTLRTISFGTALILGSVASLTLAAASARAETCEGVSCRATAAAATKPLNLMKFMGRTAAKAPAAKPKAVAASQAADHNTTARAKPGARPIAATRKPVALPVEAAAAYAAHSDPQVQVVASDELNAIDLALRPAPIETVGAAPSADPAVRLVDATDFNHIDRKAGDAWPPPFAQAVTDAPKSADAQTRNDGAINESWMQRIWSTIGSGFVALVNLVRLLIA